jgi:hypothetical protein
MPPLRCTLAVSPETRNIAAVAVGAVGAGAVVYAGTHAKKKRDGAAVIELYNTLVRGAPPGWGLGAAGMPAACHQGGLGQQHTLRLRSSHPTLRELCAARGCCRLRWVRDRRLLTLAAAGLCRWTWRTLRC